ALSHANLLSNVEQIDAHIGEFDSTFVWFNPLPIFHSFGLTGGVLLPLIKGMKTFLFPSPLQAKNIVKLIRETKSTILFATDTFVNQYARVAEDGDLASLRYIVCGAERVKPETRDSLMSKFNISIIEGYGATEAAPVVAVNQLREKNRPGTVGRLMPNLEWKLESVPGITGGGRLYVRGPNVMLGYMRVDAPGELQTMPGGWHDTGDIVSIDDEGYVSIKGRLKRFAKVGGEMVSLGAVEGYATNIWPENLHVALSVNDPKKGEQIVLLTNCKEANRNVIQAWYKDHHVNELALPKRIVFVDEVPVLGTGKIDYVASQKIIEGNNS
ncbi:MAG: AMP-binding protein, partial [Caulobacterales bacterium]|nr:AMP-binding protein [Caulobacterales bacterium]